jgi:1,2-diacylglycerol 3-alpha-glucosyltransferase
MRKIAVIFDNLGPYHIARLGAAARRCELLAIEIGAISAQYAWRPTETVPFKRATLFEAGEIRDQRTLFRRLHTTLLKHDPDLIVVPGWNYTAIDGLRSAKARSKPIVVMSESQEKDFKRNAIKEWIKRRYVGLCHAGLVGGTPQRSYLQKLGMPSGLIYTGYDVVDNSYFSAASDLARDTAAGAQAQLALPEKFFLASARFIEKKNLPGLISAYAIYRRMTLTSVGGAQEPWQLVILGDGELRPKLEAMVEKLELSGFVHMPGFKQYDELPSYYGLAGAFVHPSTTEQWGLVVNEAMACGLPVIVSDSCGCVIDLVEIGRNGYVFSSEDMNCLASLLRYISSEGCDREAMGHASRQIIARWTPDAFADGLMKAAESALARSPVPLSCLDQVLLWLMRRRSLI